MLWFEMDSNVTRVETYHKKSEFMKYQGPSTRKIKIEIK